LLLKILSLLCLATALCKKYDQARNHRNLLAATIGEKTVLLSFACYVFNGANRSLN